MEKLLTAQQVAEWFGLSVAWIYAHAKGDREPKLQCVRLGDRVRFRREDVEAFLRENRQ